jgi:electron transfer flavoprotein beta subunit
VEKSEGYDLIICGEGSSDWYNQQVPSRLGALLGIPSLTCVNKFTVTGQKIVAERNLEDSIEVVEASLPVVLSVLPDLNKPRIPSLKQILGAAKKPSQAYTPEEIGINLTEKTGAFKVKSILGADLTRKQQKIEGDSDQAKASKIVEILGKEGLIG